MIKLSCPSCNAPNELDSSDPTVGGFCNNCDYPLFLADIPELVRAARLAAADSDDSELRRAAGVEGLRLDQTVECWFCGEQLKADANVCWRCRRQQPKPEDEPATKRELELPKPPPPVQETEDVNPRDGQPVWEALAAVVVLLVLLAIVVFGLELI